MQTPKTINYRGTLYVLARRKRCRKGPQGTARFELGQPSSSVPQEYESSEGIVPDYSGSSTSSGGIGSGPAGGGAGGGGRGGAGGGGAGGGGGGG